VVRADRVAHPDAHFGSPSRLAGLVGRGSHRLHGVHPLGGHRHQPDAVPLGVAAQARTAQQRRAALEDRHRSPGVGGLHRDADQPVQRAWVEADQPGPQGGLDLDHRAAEQVGEQGVDLALTVAGRAAAAQNCERHGDRGPLQHRGELVVRQAPTRACTDVQRAPSAAVHGDRRRHPGRLDQRPDVAVVTHSVRGDQRAARRDHHQRAVDEAACGAQQARHPGPADEAVIERPRHVVAELQPTYRAVHDQRVDRLGDADEWHHRVQGDEREVVGFGLHHELGRHVAERPAQLDRERRHPPVCQLAQVVPPGPDVDPGQPQAGREQELAAREQRPDLEDLAGVHPADRAVEPALPDHHLGLGVAHHVKVEQGAEQDGHRRPVLSGAGGWHGVRIVSMPRVCCVWFVRCWSPGRRPRWGA
jgi:hypothetical protein